MPGDNEQCVMTILSKGKCLQQEHLLQVPTSPVWVSGGPEMKEGDLLRIMPQASSQSFSPCTLPPRVPC